MYISYEGVIGVCPADILFPATDLATLTVMRTAAIALLAFTLLPLAFRPIQAAEPDWPKVEQHALDLLQRYLRIPSIDPPADTRETAALFQAELEAAGLQPTLYSSGPDGQTNLIVRLPGRDKSLKPLLLLNHFDVVPADPVGWGDIDPFGAEIRPGRAGEQGDYIWSRGALDMKGIGVLQLTALIELKKAGIVPPRDIVMLSTADEETSGLRGIHWMVDNHWEELDPAYVLDEGGVSSRNLFSPGKLVAGIAAGEKQVLWLQLTARGTAGHGSQPIADNANLTLLRAIQRAMDLPVVEPPPFVAEMEQALGTAANNKFMNAIRGNTISLTSLTAGVGDPPRANVIPSTSVATLDCRLLPGVNPDEFISEVAARINDPRVSIDMLNIGVDAGISPTNTPIFEALSKATLRAHPDAVVTPILLPYGTDARVLRDMGIPAYGFNPMILSADIMATMHSDAERIPVDQFLQGLHIYYDVLTSEY